jgi:hypothetical protein
MEKRQKKRVPKRLIVRFGKSRPDVLGFTEDLSIDGLFIKATAVFDPGTVLAIQLMLPDNRQIDLTGQVVWARRTPPSLARFVKKSGMGIRLLQIPPGYTQFLSRLAAATG